MRLQWRRQRDVWNAGLALGSNARVGSPLLVVPIHDGPLNRRRLNHVLGHMSRPQVGAARLSAELSLDIDACVRC